MAGDTEGEAQCEEKEGGECSYVWDEATQLYFHAGSGFYHDPVAGWYYSSRDGFYYKFENGSYVLLESDKVNECETLACTEAVPDNPAQDQSFTQACCTANENPSSLLSDQSDAHQCAGIFADEVSRGNADCTSSDATTENLPPPSEWLEETLINLYLSGYNQAAEGSMMCSEIDGSDSCKISANGNDDIHMVVEGEIDCITEGRCSLIDMSESTADEGIAVTVDEASRDEENWRAQYGQVVQPAGGPVPNIHSLDLWHWEMVRDYRKDGKSQVARLVGRLVKRSAKLHPSVPSSGGLLKTAPICEAHLDLVTCLLDTGQVYRLRNPSARHLASLLTYDSSNPTKDWGFPELSIITEGVPRMEPGGTGEPSLSVGNHTLPDHLFTSKKPTGHGYRDRAAERRTLHGGFGLGPGQKRLSVGDVGDSSSYLPTSSEEAAAEALNISFGSGSYARKILESMGWKEGEGLGKTTKGLVEPIQGVSNVGSAGLGWPQGRKKHHY